MRLFGRRSDGLSDPSVEPCDRPPLEHDRALAAGDLQRSGEMPLGLCVVIGLGEHEFAHQPLQLRLQNALFGRLDHLERLGERGSSELEPSLREAHAASSPSAHGM